MNKKQKPNNMKKLFILLVAIFTLAILAAPQKTEASHLVAGDITYQYVSPGVYLVTVTLYRDCDGISLGSSVNLNFNSSCGSGSISLPQLGTATQIAASPCLPPQTTSCNGGNAYGVEEWVYQGLVTLPANCNDWVFSTQSCCRNSQITNIQSPGSQSFYLPSSLNSTVAPTNSSPVFSNIPVSQFCVGNQFFYDQGATDPDGDSLVYSLVCPSVGAGGNFVQYNPPLSCQNPVTSAPPGVQIDPQTGIITFLPTAQQVTVLAVQVDEYRNGTLIGSIVRDMQINIIANCIINTPTWDSTIVAQTGNAIFANCGDTSVVVLLQDPVQCGSAAADGSDFRIVSSSGVPNPSFSAVPLNCSGGVTTEILVNLYTPLTAGVHWLFTKEGNDNNTLLSDCGASMNEFDSVPIVVVDTSELSIVNVTTDCVFGFFEVTFSDALDCYTFSGDGSDFLLIDANGNSLPIDQILPIGCNVANPNVTTFQFYLDSAVQGASPIHLIVQSGSDANTVSNACGRFLDTGDTLAVISATSASTLDLGPDQTVCEGTTLNLSAPTIANAAYSWTLNGTGVGTNSNTYSNNPVTPADGGTYIVTFDNGAGCTGIGTVDVTIETFAEAPVVTCTPVVQNALYAYGWAAVAGATSYEISLDGGTTWIAVNNGAGPNTHQLNNPPDFVIVRAIKAGPCNPGKVSEDASCDFDIIIPNVITPNDDMYNEAFVIQYLERHPNSSLEIRNR
ncbi:MAG: hypothetical protein HKN75_01805, partial [Bacteroidia bacterium]|nr:hypothetical protein [Bacteroidia bacterium]